MMRRPEEACCLILRLPTGSPLMVSAEIHSSTLLSVLGTLSPKSGQTVGVSALRRGRALSLPTATAVTDNEKAPAAHLGKGDILTGGRQSRRIGDNGVTVPAGGCRRLSAHTDGLADAMRRGHPTGLGDPRRQVDPIDWIADQRPLLLWQAKRHGVSVQVLPDPGWSADRGLTRPVRLHA